MSEYTISYQRRIVSKIRVENEASNLLRRLLEPYNKHFFVCDSNTAGLLKKHVGKANPVYVVEAGEGSKSLTELKSIYEFLLKNGVDRESVIIGFGGGVVTDIAGFAAATILRGIDCILVPTSLLGMVDAAIGGKNGINLGNSKNQIGTIVQPRHILVDPSLLRSLPEDDIKSGCGELLKYAVALRPDLFKLLQTTEPTDKRVIEMAVSSAVEVVNQDPYEQTKQRYVLNFGHTLGHTIESVSNLHIGHGQAVAEGIAFATFASQKLSTLKETEAQSINSLIKKLGFRFEAQDPAKLIPYLSKDKKREGDKIDLVLIKAIGRPIIHKIKLSVLSKLVKEFYKNSTQERRD